MSIMTPAVRIPEDGIDCIFVENYDAYIEEELKAGGAEV
jgi:hypothetical protein